MPFELGLLGMDMLPFLSSDTTINVFKALLLGGTARMIFAAFAPPKKAPERRGWHDPAYKGKPFEFVVQYLASSFCVIVPAFAISHALLLLIHHVPWMMPAGRSLCPSGPDSLEPLTGLHARFLAGTLLVVLGTALRTSAYRALGPLFANEVFIRDDHRLITAGPYKYVRHPSYTGLLLLFLGTHLIHFGDDGYAAICGITTTPMAPFVYVWKYDAPFAVLSIVRRCGVEDRKLHERFGAEWEKYREDVQYRLVPFVY